MSKRTSYWVIVACGNEGYWTGNRFMYSQDELDRALEDCAQLMEEAQQAGRDEFYMVTTV